MKAASLDVASPPSRPVPVARALPVDQARALLGAEAKGLSDAEVQDIAWAVSRHVSAAFGMVAPQ